MTEDTESGVPRGPARPPSTTPPGAAEVCASLREDLHRVLEKHARTNYTSASSLGSKPTGNRYQSISLGGDVLQGFRSRRSDVLDKVRFEGARVLDVGCNYGEMSRAARERGAALVDGFDYDPYFILIGRLINVFNDLQRVSLYVADATDATAYCGEYDIVMAFSVFPYIEKALPALVQATKKILILETHQLSGPLSLEPYMEKLRPHFPAHRLLGATEWGTNLYGQGYREIYAFARETSMLDDLLLGENVRQGPSEGGVIDLTRSYLGFLKQFEGFFGDSLRRGFDHLLNEANNANLAQFGYDDRKKVGSGVAYWLAFLQGFSAYTKTGSVAEDDPFVALTQACYAEKPFDKGLADVVGDEDRLAARVASRYRTLEKIRAGHVNQVEPVVVYKEGKPIDHFHLFDKKANCWISCAQFDGYHRLFSAVVCRCDGLRFVRC